jgi:hypothetical protein
LTDDGRAHGRRNQEQQRFAEHYVSSLWRHRPCPARLVAQPC